MTTSLRLSTEVRRHDIVEEARQIVASRGFEGLTTRRLARAVGVTEGALYRHFPSKHDILLALIDEIEETLFQAVEQAKEEGGAPLEKLERLLRARLTYAERRRGVTFVVMSEVLLNGNRELRQRIQAVTDRYLATVADLLEEGVRSGEVSPEVNRDAAALAFFGLVQATVTLWRFADSELPLVERHEALWRVFREGVAAKPMRT